MCRGPSTPAFRPFFTLVRKIDGHTVVEKLVLHVTVLLGYDNTCQKWHFKKNFLLDFDKICDLFSYDLLAHTFEL